MEIFTQMSPLAPYDNILGQPDTFTLFNFLLTPVTKGLIRLDSNSNLKYNNCYLQGEDLSKLDSSYRNYSTDTSDISRVAASIDYTMNNIPKYTNSELAFGPGKTSGYNITDFVINPKGLTIPGTQYTPFTRLGINHWSNSVPLSDIENFGTDPKTLLIKGTSNIYCVDASIYPDQPPCHPIAGLYMMAEKASDILIKNIENELANYKTYKNKINLPKNLPTNSLNKKTILFISLIIILSIILIITFIFKKFISLIILLLLITLIITFVFKK
jgi:hypothetical protein